jgi:cation diffusion facilitator family transporter
MNIKGENTLRSVLIALAGNIFVTLLKFGGYFLTCSPTMLAEAFHSSADILNQTLLFIGITSAKKKSSQQHPWGMGAMQYLFNFLSAVGIFTLGCVLTLWHTGWHLFNPEKIDSKWFWVNIVILLVSFFIEGYSCLNALDYIWKEKGKEHIWIYLKKMRDPTLVAVFLEDGAALTGIVIALIGVTLSQIFHTQAFDVISSFVIGVLMGLVAVFLGVSNALFLIGKSVDLEKEESYREFLEQLDIVEKVVEIRTEFLGPNRVHLSIKVELHPTFIIDTDQLKKDMEAIKNQDMPIMKVLMDVADRSVRATGRAIVGLEKQIRKEFPEVVSIDFEQN